MFAVQEYQRLILLGTVAIFVIIITFLVYNAIQRKKRLKRRREREKHLSSIYEVPLWTDTFHHDIPAGYYGRDIVKEGNSELDTRQSEPENELMAPHHADSPHDDIFAGNNIADNVEEKNTDELEKLKYQLVKGFIDSYFTTQQQITDVVRRRVETITDMAVSRLFASGADVLEILGRPDAQECMRVMQSRHASNGDYETAQLMIDMFIGYAMEPSNTVLKGVAEDALVTLPKLTWKQMDILSLLFLLKHTRGLENGDPENFHRYITDYLIPFSSSIPVEHYVYQYIEYLGCGTIGPPSVTLERILLDSYPALFKYVGFSRDELNKVLDGQEFDPGMLAPSLYHDSHHDAYLKLNAIDDIMAVKLLSESALDAELVSELMKLQQTRPIECKEEDVKKVLPLIHPDLTYLSAKWCESPLHITRLSIKGIYIAHANIRRKLGVNMDLSIWGS